MTSTEPLQFSVMSAPLAAMDRRALSQAWYSALYRQTAPVRAQNLAARNMPSACAPKGALQVSARQTPPPLQTQMRVRENTAGMIQPHAAVERRQIRCALARKIERALLHPQSGARSATFRIRGVPGRVHVMLRSGARGLQLIAVCTRDARGQVATALAQARYALAARGITLDAQLRCEERPC